ncbi:PH domain-containing protein [Frankia sp. Cr1]|uniref:PH domain-containing protein n=1 Tax=Frankia sp. Cr1 TaxID=3073931 RepID=UPI002AD536D3|nr:PH domain-containing protein [Frankia sp. Cr1]
MTSADEPAVAALTGGWRRLHPLSPLVRAGRHLVAVAAVVLSGAVTRQQDASGQGAYWDLAVIAVVVVIGVVSWLVTRWQVDNGTLRIETGLLRRSSQRYPLTQIQAIDLVESGLARLLGLAELHLRMAASGGATGRLACLRKADAEVLRARLLALAHGVAEDSPPPPERLLVALSTRRLVVSILLSSQGVITMITVGAFAVVAAMIPAAVGALGGAAGFVIGMLTAAWRRFNSGFELTVSVAADGLHLRSGAIQTAAETIPFGRVQAVQLVEPLLWRPLRWCRLEVEVAGRQVRNENRPEGRQLRAILPVGDHGQAAYLLSQLIPGAPVADRPAPPRARWKAPVRYHYLSWGGNDSCVVTTSGRVRRITRWIPLEKVQSIRRVQGPVQRMLGLATIHLDTAGRRIQAELTDRDVDEVDRQLAVLPGQCRAARHGQRLPRSTDTGFVDQVTQALDAS